MTVLDASVLIAYLSKADVHHGRAVALLTRTSDGLVVSPLTLAELLVGPTRAGQRGQAEAVLAGLGVEVLPLTRAAPARLAELRVGSRLPLPDCCVLLAAEQTGAAVATFDDRLARAAADLGLPVAET